MDQSGSISQNDLEVSLNTIGNTLAATLDFPRTSELFASVRTFDDGSYALMPADTGQSMPASTSANDFVNLASQSDRIGHRGTAIMRALRETANRVLGSDMQNLTAKVLILVTDGMTLEECGTVDRVGLEDNCVEREIQRFKDAGWAVVVITPMPPVSSEIRQMALEHLQRLTHPRDGGVWNPQAGNGGGWMCPTGACDISEGMDSANSAVFRGAQQTLFIQSAPGDTNAGAVSLPLIHYTLDLVVDQIRGDDNDCSSTPSASPTPSPTPSLTPEPSEPSCVDTAPEGVTDRFERPCTWYNDFAARGQADFVCEGAGDSSTFSVATMCCGCGGGRVPTTTPAPTPLTDLACTEHVDSCRFCTDDRSA